MSNSVTGSSTNSATGKDPVSNPKRPESRARNFIYVQLPPKDTIYVRLPPEDPIYVRLPPEEESYAAEAQPKHEDGVPSNLANQIYAPFPKLEDDDSIAASSSSTAGTFVASSSSTPTDTNAQLTDSTIKQIFGDAPHLMDLDETPAYFSKDPVTQAEQTLRHKEKELIKVLFEKSENLKPFWKNIAKRFPDLTDTGKNRKGIKEVDDCLKAYANSIENRDEKECLNNLKKSIETYLTNKKRKIFNRNTEKNNIKIIGVRHLQNRLNKQASQE